MKRSKTVPLLLASLVLVVMLIGLGRATSAQSITAIPSDVTSNPWFQLTLLDAYCGFLFVCGWVIYRERSRWAKFVWCLLILLTGNIAVAIYVIVALVRLDGRHPVLPQIFVRAGDHRGASDAIR